MRRAGGEGLVALADPWGACARSKTSRDLASPAAVRWRVGDRVQARYRATVLGPTKTLWFAGRITARHSDSRCDITYDDGDSEARVELSFIKPPRYASDRDAADSDSAPAEAAAGAVEEPTEPAAKRPRRSTPSKVEPQPPHASMPQARPLVPEDLVQRRVRVWWDGDGDNGVWYAGKAMGYSRARGHVISYDDGTRGTIRLGDRPGQMEDEWPWELE